MAKKNGKRVSLVDAQLEIDGDKAFDADQIEDDGVFDAMSWIDPREEMSIEEERLQREEDERWAAINRANDEFLFDEWDLHYWACD